VVIATVLPMVVPMHNRDRTLAAEAVVEVDVVDQAAADNGPHRTYNRNGGMTQ